MSYLSIQNITYTLWELRPSLGCWGGSSCRSFYALCHSLYAVHQPLNLYMLQIQCSFREFRSSAKALNGFLLPASQVSYEQDRGHSFRLVCECISIWHFSLLHQVVELNLHSWKSYLLTAMSDRLRRTVEINRVHLSTCQ